MKKAISFLLCLSCLLSLGVCAYASGEASGAMGGGALPSGGNFGDVKTGVVNNTVVLIDGEGVSYEETAADVFRIAEGGGITAEGVDGLYLQQASVYNSVNESGATQGVSGVTFVDVDGHVGGYTDYYAVDEGGDPLALPAVTEGDGYNTVIILDDEDDAFVRSANEIAMGAALNIGGGTEENVLVVENTYLWTSGFKRTSLFADDQAAELVVRDSRIVCPGSDNYKLGWQALYGGSRATLLQNGDCWFFNSEIVTEGWGALAIDSSPGLDLYATNCVIDVLGGGYVSYTPGDGSVNLFCCDANSAQYGIFVTGNSTAFVGGMMDSTEEARARMDETKDMELPPVTEDAGTHIHADYSAYLTHQGGGNSTTTEAYLAGANSTLSTVTDLRIADNSHFLNDSYGGTSWFWTEMWRGSTCLCRSTNATFEFDNMVLESRTGVIFQTVVNWEGASKSFTLEEGVEAVGNSLIMRNMDVTGDIRNDDIYRNLKVDLTDATVTGAMVSTTVDTWNAMWTVDALEASPAYEAALAEQKSWAEEIPNLTYDAEYPYADFVLDLEQVSANLTMPAYDQVNGIELTMNDGAVWNVSGDSQLKSLVMAESASIQAAPGFEIEIYVNCEKFDITTGEKIDALTAGAYENVVIVCIEAAASGEAGGSTIVLKGATLLDATYNGEELDVLVQDGKIVEVGENLSGDEVIDLTGYTLMPGMIDAHVHVAGSSGYGIDLLTTWAQNGITSVREEGMLSTSGEMEFVDLIDEANADPTSAYLVSCGKYLDVTGGYGMGPTGNMGIVITTPEEAAAEIEYKAELGYPQVKVGINSDEYRMTAEQFIAIIETAHENGLEVAAHVNYAAHLEELVAYGIDEAAHTPSDEMSGALINGMVENDVSMNTSGAENYEDIKIANLKAFYEAGGIITVGTDLMRNYDTCMETLVSEMAVLAKAGLSVQEVIACATRNNARALELNTGEIAVGFEADFLAVEGDVDETFEALCAAAFVMNDGVVIVG